MTSAGPSRVAAGQQQGGKHPHGHHQQQQQQQQQQQHIGNAGLPPTKQNLKSWWRGFKLSSKTHEPNEPRPPQGIFGVPLHQSIAYANVAISLIDEHGKSYIYGYVPIVVAKCGVFLKEKATEVEGIFRLNGSEKRIKDLKTVFDSPDRYGKGLVWDGYTVHDAANVLRRYLNDLPEPVVPLGLYEKFRDPLRGATRQAVGDAEGPQFVDNFDIQTAIARYQQLIKELPPLNRQLLLYLLDLLAVFAAKADQNRMNSQNLAAIFQPGILSHPSHSMAPEEYRLNQCVLIFLIENQDHFLIGMQGTAADAKTVEAVQQGTPVLNEPSFNEASDIDQLDEAIGAAPGVEGAEKENKKRWRLSRRKEDLTPIFNTAMPTIPPSPRNMIGSNAHAEASSSSIGSAGAHKAPRQSFSVGEPFHSDATLGESSNRDVSSSGSGREDVRGLTGWIKNKVRGDKKDRDTNQGRSKSPPRERPGALGSVLHGKSVDVKYSTPEEGRAQEFGGAGRSCFARYYLL
ncbi:hypothetical protein P8C59_006820 [Phyllachora maydis]|uniref:Rho-GAP domain-containing protein n=1 Tax=Phyllachora maydis TaxID=1825666 RepID=A0AAD9MFY0_9PEZI|nr:hypothetical protein P8C59_006820 [Phyllachora maydis]